MNRTTLLSYFQQGSPNIFLDRARFESGNSLGPGRRRGLTSFRRQLCAPSLAPTVERLVARQFSVCRQGNDFLVRLSVEIVSSSLTSGQLYLSQRTGTKSCPSKIVLQRMPYTGCNSRWQLLECPPA